MEKPYAWVVLTEKELSVRGKIGELKYWYVTRKTRKFIPWVARHLPSKVKYWVVIDSMVRAEPNENPSNVTGMEMLDLYKDKVEH
jgi:hypothetical protein